MTLVLSDGAARALLDSGLATAFPAGSILEERSGAPPGPNAAPTGTLLASVTLPATPFAAAAGRLKAKSGVWAGVGAAGAGSGTAVGHFRLKLAGDSGAADASQVRLEGTAAGAVIGSGTVSCTTGTATFSTSQAGVIQNGYVITVAGVQYTVSAFNGTTSCTLSGSPTFGASSFTVAGAADMTLDNNSIAVNQVVTVNSFSVAL